MSIPGTKTYSGPTMVDQALIDELPTVLSVQQWLADRNLAPGDVTHVCCEQNWAEPGYDPYAIWFYSAGTDAAEELSAYGFDVYDQGGGKWYAFLPDDRVAI